MQKYAPLLQQAGIALDAQEQYLPELVGVVSAILDTYFEGLKGNELDP